ncbi:unnamed protein product [Protopolystoma xenopodis]|uniref:Uncharacterized protein n=1 Tax=Protopolystoma xenopodis TaxID=117903 RepID=A0A3S5BA14_9PLAT|nr:unnamed protein product [Protopolystoma xenopodis]
MSNNDLLDAAHLHTHEPVILFVVRLWTTEASDPFYETHIKSLAPAVWAPCRTRSPDDLCLSRSDQRSNLPPMPTFIARLRVVGPNRAAQQPFRLGHMNSESRMPLSVPRPVHNLMLPARFWAGKCFCSCLPIRYFFILNLFRVIAFYLAETSVARLKLHHSRVAM